MPKLTKRAFLIYWLPVIVWLGVISAESLSPYAASDQTSRFIIPALHWLFPRLDPLQLVEIHHVLRKIGHFTGYGLLSFFIFRAWRGTHHVHAGTGQVLTRAFRSSGATLVFSDYWRANWAVLAMLCTAAIATFDEVHQMSLRSRTGTWWDVLLDSIGALVFQFVTYLIIAAQARRRKPKQARAEVMS